MEDSNIGESGVKSTRLLGKRIENLPPHMSAQAMQQLPGAYALEKQNAIKTLMAEYPRVTREYLEGRIREATTAKKDFLQTKIDTKGKIKEYRQLIKQAAGRKSMRDIEPELEAIRTSTTMEFEEKKAAVAELRRDLVDYSVDDLYDQIDLFEENITRLDIAIEAESNSIAELREVMGQIAVRDKKLRELGVDRIE